MSLQLDTGQLQALLRDFHTLTGIRIVIFDEEYREILGYPARHSPFCTLMKANGLTRALCAKSDARSFDQCKATGKLVVTQCHAGLIEAAAPLKDKGLIIGYIMFGQLTGSRDRQQLLAGILEQHAGITAPAADLTAAVRQVKYRSMPEIQAAAKILEAITTYALLNNMVSVRHEQLIHKLNHYIDDHLAENLDSRQLCRQLLVSRTRLYELARQYLGTGLAAYVTRKRMALACQLLTAGSATIGEIAARTGYADYSYFCKVFRRTQGCSPAEYRLREQERWA